MGSEEVPLIAKTFEPDHGDRAAPVQLLGIQVTAAMDAVMDTDKAFTVIGPQVTGVGRARWSGDVATTLVIQFGTGVIGVGKLMRTAFGQGHVLQPGKSVVGRGEHRGQTDVRLVGCTEGEAGHVSKGDHVGGGESADDTIGPADFSVQIAVISGLGQADQAGTGCRPDSEQAEARAMHYDQWRCQDLPGGGIADGDAIVSPVTGVSAGRKDQAQA